MEHLQTVVVAAGMGISSVFQSGCDSLHHLKCSMASLYDSMAKVQVLMIRRIGTKMNKLFKGG
jgi:hypothetical protein